MDNPLEAVARWAFGAICGVVGAGMLYLLAWLVFPPGLMAIGLACSLAVYIACDAAAWLKRGG